MQGVWPVGMPVSRKGLLHGYKEEQEGSESGKPLRGCGPRPGKGAGRRWAGKNIAGNCGGGRWRG